MKIVKRAFLQIIRKLSETYPRVMDKIRYRIDNLEARIADSIIEGIDAIKIGGMELDHARKTIISPKENLNGRITTPTIWLRMLTSSSKNLCKRLKT